MAQRRADAQAQEIANGFAAQATQAWLTARGLAAEIADLLAANDDTLVPAPGLEELAERAATSAGDACNVADSVRTLLGQPVDAEREQALLAALAFANVAMATTEQTTRRLAQLLLGVTSQAGWNDAIGRAERAAVITLQPFGGRGVPLANDDLTFYWLSPADLTTDVAGTLCRMIIEHDCTLDLLVSSDPSKGVRFRVDHVGNLEATCLGDDLAAQTDTLHEIGWATPGSAPDVFVATWRDPMTVLDPTTLAVRTLIEIHGVFSPAQLEVCCTTE